MSSSLVQGRAEGLPSALTKFTEWLALFGETSYDHQSYFAGPIGGRAKALYYRSKKLGIMAVAPMILSEALWPAGRQLFWRKQRFPIADAHYAMGFAFLHGMTGDDAHYRRASHFLEVLEQTRCPGYARAGWGYPFDWVTRTGVMHAQTPLISTTPYVYEAFDAVYRIDGQKRWLNMMQSAAEHAFIDIKDRELSAEATTAGYNPLDGEGNVINASAYRAWLLMSASRQFSRDDYRHAAERNLNYVLQSQQPDGSWQYATDGVRDFVDHFHTCFVLKALAKIDALIDHPRCRAAIDAGVRYYSQNLFDDEGLPRPFARAPRLTVYKRELYDYAECINICVLLGRFDVLQQRLDSTLGDLLAHWQTPHGSFRSRRLVLGWDNVPMHRWAQAQIFRSLAFLSATAKNRVATVGRPPAPVEALEAALATPGTGHCSVDRAF